MNKIDERKCIGQLNLGERKVKQILICKFDKKEWRNAHLKLNFFNSS